MEQKEPETGYHAAPFFWQHGESDEALLTEIGKIQESGCQALCVESRPHQEFGRSGWWQDMGLILKECRRRGMRVWLLDDKHFPTGYANGLLAEKDPSLRRRELTERHVDVTGPVADGAVMADAWLGGGEDRILAALACRRVKNSEALTGEVIDVTSGLSDGLLYLTLPSGCWRIIFLLEMESSIPEWRKLYCDPLSSESMDVLVEAVYEPHWEHFKEYFGNTFAGFFSDEPCFGNQDGGFVGFGKRFAAYPFRREILPLLREEYGENPLLLLPALWFPMGPSATARARIGFMNVVTKLYRKNFSEKLGNWSRAHGVSYIGHIIEDNGAHTKTGCSAGHFFRSMEGQDMSGIDVVLHQIVPGLTEYPSAGLVSYESCDPRFFHYTLAKLGASHAHLQPEKKGRAMCEIFGAYGWAEGLKTMKWLVNHMLVRGINYFVPHAFSPTFPDPDCPPHFYAGGHNPQYPGFHDLMTYTNRMCNLISGGTHVCSCGLLYHAEAEWSGSPYDPVDKAAKLLFDRQLDFEIFPSDYLERAVVEGKTLKIGTQPIPAVVVPYSACLPALVLQRLREYSRKGVPVFFLKEFPSCTPEGEDPEQWRDPGFRVLPYEALPDALRGLKLGDLRLGEAEPLLRVYHMREGTKEKYLLFWEEITRPLHAFFRIPGFSGGRYLEYSGKPEAHCYSSGSEEIPLDLSPYEAKLFVFGEIPADIPEEKRLVKKSSRELSGTWRVSVSGQDGFVPYEETARLIPLTVPGRLPRFGGTARYVLEFEADPGRDSWRLDLGRVGETAEVALNGRPLGRAIAPPYVFSCAGALRPGKNVLQVDVATHLGYRMRDPFSKYLLFEPAGLLGPVTLDRF